MATNSCAFAPTLEGQVLQVLRDCVLDGGELLLRGGKRTLFHGRIGTFHGWMVGFAPSTVPTYRLDEATLGALCRGSALRDGSVLIDGERYGLWPEERGGARWAVLRSTTDGRGQDGTMAARGRGEVRRGT